MRIFKNLVTTSRNTALILLVIAAAVAVLCIVPVLLRYLLGIVVAVLMLNGVYHIGVILWRAYLKVLSAIYSLARTIFPQL